MCGSDYAKLDVSYCFETSTNWRAAAHKKCVQSAAAQLEACACETAFASSQYRYVAPGGLCKPDYSVSFLGLLTCTGTTTACDQGLSSYCADTCKAGTRCAPGYI